MRPPSSESAHPRMYGRRRQSLTPLKLKISSHLRLQDTSLNREFTSVPHRNLRCWQNQLDLCGALVKRALAGQSANSCVSAIGQNSRPFGACARTRHDGRENTLRTARCLASRTVEVLLSASSPVRVGGSCKSTICGKRKCSNLGALFCEAPFANCARTRFTLTLRKAFEDFLAIGLPRSERCMRALR